MKRTFDGEDLRRARTGTEARSRTDREWIRSLYLGEVRHVDDQVGRLMRALKEMGLYDEMLIIFTSDHGEEFWEHGGIEHGHTMYRELLSVPLLVKPPDCHVAGVCDTLVGIESIMPTILDACQVAYDEESLGHSSLASFWDPGAAPFAGRPVVSGGTMYGEDRDAVTSAGWKYIRPLASGIEMLFDLHADPGERHDLCTADPVQLRRMRDLLAESVLRAERLREKHGIRTEDEPLLDDAARERLRALGYID
jgi:arylsulfatase A-like enzyme